MITTFKVLKMMRTKTIKVMSSMITAIVITVMALRLVAMMLVMTMAVEMVTKTIWELMEEMRLPKNKNCHSKFKNLA